MDGRKKILIISVTACIFVILLAVALANFGFFNMVQGLFIPRGEVLDGTLPIAGSLGDKDIPVGEIKFRINKEIIFENGYAKGNIMLENPKTCDYSISFSFNLQTDSRQVYYSPKIKPGQCLNGDKLDVKLRKGTYKCVYTAHAYKTDGTLAGTTQGNLTITVKD